MDLIVNLFRGKVINQKRLFKLIYYYRPRAFQDWVYISARIWQEEIVSSRLYLDFITILINAGLLAADDAYWHAANPGDSYSRKYKLKLPPESSIPLEKDGYFISDYYAAIKFLRPRVRDREQYTGVRNQRFYDNESGD